MRRTKLKRLAEHIRRNCDGWQRSGSVAVTASTGDLHILVLASPAELFMTVQISDARGVLGRYWPAPFTWPRRVLATTAMSRIDTHLERIRGEGIL